MLAWHELETERGVGFEFGPIPCSAIRAWTRSEQLDADAARVVLGVIEHLESDRADRLAVERIAQKQGAKP